MRIRGHSLFSVLALACVACPLALAQPDQSGIDMVRIGATNNPAYDGVDPLGYTRGRGSVGYEYHIGRYEVTCAQWVEFYYAALNRPDPILWVQTPCSGAAHATAPPASPSPSVAAGACSPPAA